MTIHEEHLVISAYNATLPWNSMDAMSRLEIKTDSQELIDKCCACPYFSCFNCLDHRSKEPKFDRFVSLFSQQMSRADICSELKISKSSYFNYKKRLLEGDTK